MAKIRVHELAKELGLSSKEMVDTLHNLGLDVKNHMSTMEETQASWVKKRLTQKEEPKPVAKPNPEKKVTRQEQPQPRPPRRPEAAPQSRPTGGQGSGENFNRVNRAPAGDQRNTGHQDNRQLGSDRPRPNNERSTPPNNFNRAPAPTGQRPAPTGQRPAPTGQRPGPAGGDRPGQQRPNNAGANRAPYQGGQRPAARNEKPEQQRQSPARPANAPNSGWPRPKADNKAAKPNLPRPAASPVGERSDANKNKPARKAQSPQQDKSFSRPFRKPKHKRKKENVELQTPELISIDESIMVRDLAEKLNKNPAEIMKKLMELGVMATINQLIDYETVEILASLYEVKVERSVSEEEKILEEIIDEDSSLKLRPPVVTVMGHVDHGKTSLLDRIRKSNVVSGEAGGITQHIGAYQVKVNDNKVTFIDTPGHEAFTAMRARGANLTDIVILVVAADDGVMPQTVEAINHIKAANVPFIVAINKIDKPDADPERLKQQLTEYAIVAEEWGGDTIFVPVSAKTGQGIENLLEMVLLVAEMHEIKANPDRAASGIVIEGQLDKGRGAVATVLVLNGTLKIGDYIICGTDWCRVRAMNDDRGRRVDKAYPSMPVEIMGWSGVPEAGGKVQVCDEKVAKEVISLRVTEKKIEEQKQSSRVSLDDFFKQIQDNVVKELNLIIKGDVQGSVEALAQSLIRLATSEVKVNVIHSAVGAITETDVMLASASNAIIIGFNVRPDSKARKYAEDEKIDVRLYRVIYEAIDDVKKAMTGLLDPQYKEKYLGRAEVRTLFKIPNVGMIAGSYVNDGSIQRNANVRVLRDGVIIYEGTLTSLKRFKDDAKEVLENYECGIGIKDFNDLKEGDIIEAYTMEEVPREL
ncbi:MAG: translation initiation factor IF-2 [Syntrophomonas sp.]